jgi:tetratricopeptide (TPR) repeat protein
MHRSERVAVESEVPAGRTRAAVARFGLSPALLAAALLAAGVLGSALAACNRGPAALDPVPPGEVGALDREVVDLVGKHADLVRASPSSARAHGSLGLVYEANGLWDPAQRSFANAAILDPGQPLWDYHRAIALREAGNAAEALVLLRRAAVDLPEEPSVQHRFGQALLDGGEIEAARAAFSRALALAPGQPECLVGLANAEVQRGAFEPARDLALQAVRVAPEFEQAHYVLGLAYRGLGRTDDAARELARGAGARTRHLADPLDAEFQGYVVNFVGQRNAANQLASRGEHAAAARMWERVLAKEPDDKSALTNYAAVLIHLDRLDEAERALGRSLALDPNEFATHLNLSDLRRRRGDLEAALRAAERAVELAPEVAQVHMTRARVLNALDRFEDARGALGEDARLDPGDASSRIAIAETFMKEERRLEAIPWYRQALAIDPNSLPVRINLAGLTFQSGDIAGARSQMAELLRLAPGDPKVQLLAKQMGMEPRR